MRYSILASRRKEIVRGEELKASVSVGQFSRNIGDRDASGVRTALFKTVTSFPGVFSSSTDHFRINYKVYQATKPIFYF